MSQGGRLVSPVLLLSVFVISTTGLVYQLIAGTLASYVLGDSVAQVGSPGTELEFAL